MATHEVYEWVQYIKGKMVQKPRKKPVGNKKKNILEIHNVQQLLDNKRGETW